MDSVLPSEFDLMNGSVNHLQEEVKKIIRLLVYLRSSVTALYPLDDPLIDTIFLNFSTLLNGKTSEASWASFSRIWCVLRFSTELLKYSAWFWNSYRGSPESEDR